MNSLVGALAPSFREAQRVLQRALMGADGAEATWRQCISDTNNVLGLALSSMFVREVFDEQSKPVVCTLLISVLLKMTVLLYVCVSGQTWHLIYKLKNTILYSSDF